MFRKFTEQLWATLYSLLFLFMTPPPPQTVSLAVAPPTVQFLEICPTYPLSYFGIVITVFTAFCMLAKGICFLFYMFFFIYNRRQQPAFNCSYLYPDRRKCVTHYRMKSYLNTFLVMVTEYVPDHALLGRGRNQAHPEEKVTCWQFKDESSTHCRKQGKHQLVDYNIWKKKSTTRLV